MTLIISISNELTPHGYFSIAECDGITVRKAKGGTIHPLARLLQDAGHHRDTPVIVQRDGLLVFKECPLWKWADFDLFEPDNGPMRYVRFNYEAAEKWRKERECA